jgi:hypothetical protein
VDACVAADEDVPTCVAANIEAARRAGTGWLLVSRDDRIEPGWWDQAATAAPGLAVRSIQLPLRMVRAGTPPAHYRYGWQPAPGAAR